MIEGLKPYSEYKDSGQKWLGSIPAHWDVRRTKLILREVDSRSTTGKEQLLRVSQYTGVTQRKPTDGSESPDTRAASLVGYKRVTVNDLVINIMLAWNGSMGVSRYDGIASPAYCVYRLNKGAHPWYFHELFRLPLYKGRIKAVSTGVIESRLRLYSDDLGRIEAIIHRAVTRGLNHDVPLKPSGIPWLGNIPEHWEVRQVRRATSFVTSGSRGWANFYSDDGLVFIQSGNLGRNMALNFSYTQYVRPPSGAEGERTRVHRDDLLICITGALTGNVVHVDQELPGPSFVNQHVALVRVRKATVRPRFLAFALRSEIGQAQFKTSEYGGTKQGLGLGDVKDVFFPLPSLTEQDAIIAHIDSSLSVFTTAIARTEREIALMQEYRTRLTADIVTGTLDVREAAARMADPPAEPVIDTSDEPEAEATE